MLNNCSGAGYSKDFNIKIIVKYSARIKMSLTILCCALSAGHGCGIYGTCT